MIEFVTVQRLAAHVGAPESDQWAADAVAAVNALLAGYPWLLDDDGEPDAAATTGALMLAGRLYRRKNSLSGVEALGDTGALYVARTDPDIARLLRIEQHATPKVG